MEKYTQQGDVVLVCNAKIPADVEIVKGNVVEHGELTGHAHRLDEQAGAQMFIQKATGKRFLRIVQPTALKHEEHHTQVLQPGDFEIRRVRETDHMEGVTRQVAD